MTVVVAAVVVETTVVAAAAATVGNLKRKTLRKLSVHRRMAFFMLKMMFFSTIYFIFNAEH
jgi:hypothetical protein